MGYNSVFFALNDLADGFRKSPNGYAHLLTYAHELQRGIYDDRGARSVWEHANEIAAKHGEPRLHPQALEAIACFHADETRYFMAGGNCMTDLGYPVKYGVEKDRRTGEEYQTVTLRLPEYQQKQWRKRREEEAKKKQEARERRAAKVVK